MDHHLLKLTKDVKEEYACGTLSRIRGTGDKPIEQFSPPARCVTVDV